MKKTRIATLAATAALLTAGVSGLVIAKQIDAGRQILLSVDFEPRIVSQVDVGDFHFKPGQLAPIHTHAAPAIGYVSKGTIYYQVEGMPAQILKTGDAFYEPVGPRILHFDNASQTEEAVFTDFNLQQEGEPFIVFPKPPTEKIDRRTFPTAKIGGAKVSKAEAFAENVQPGKPLLVSSDTPVVGYVAEGTVTLSVGEGKTEQVEQGRNFYVPGGAKAKLSTTSASAKIVSFYIR